MLGLSLLARKGLIVMEIIFAGQEQIAYFPSQEAVHLLVHFKFLRVYDPNLYRMVKDELKSFALSVLISFPPLLS